MDRVSGVRRTVLGFVLAMIAATLVIQVDLASGLPGIDGHAPREVPIAVVGPEPDVGTMRDALNGPPEHPLAARILASERLARDQMQQRDVNAALIMGDDGRHRLLVASAADRAAARTVERTVREILDVSDQTVDVTDVVAQDPRDPDGIGSYRLGAYWSILGVAFAGLLGLVFGARSSARKLVTLRFAGLLGGAIVSGIAGAVVSRFVLDRFDAPFLPLAGIGVLVVLGVGAVSLALIAWFGIWGLLVAAVVVIGLGIPGAIGAWSLDGLSAVWPTMLAWLPPGAAAWAVRGIAYFDGDGTGRVVLMSLGWAIAGYLLSLLAATSDDDDPRLRRFHPLLRKAPVVSAGLGILAVGVLVALPASPSFTRTDLRPALTIECEPFARPTSVKQLNREIEENRVLEGFVGGDVGASATVEDGRLLFVFGDTLREAGYARELMVRNSMLVYDDDCLGAVQRRDKGALVPDRADGVGYWPMSIGSVEVDGHNLVGVMVQRVRSDTGDSEANDFAFTNLGPALALFVVSPDQPPVLQRVADIGPDEESTTRPTWGAAAWVEGDTVYLYGTSRDPDGGFGFALSVARVKLTEIGDGSRWRYWDGQRWQRDADRAAELIGQSDGVSQTLSVFREGDTWYALTKQSEFLGTNLVTWTAPSPQGPFTLQPPLAKIPSTDVDLRYMPLAHPELLPKDGTMVVSVSRNTTETDQIASDPSLYRPEFLRVDLP